MSDEDYEWLCQWKWYVSNESRGTKWYAIRRESRQGKRFKVRMHHAVMQRVTGGRLCPGFVVDHFNHNSLDNRRENLRSITQRENMLASPGWKKRNVEKMELRCDLDPYVLQRTLPGWKK